MDPAGIQSLLSAGPYGVAALCVAGVIWQNAQIGKLYDRLIATEQKHQTDITAVNNQRAAEIATLGKIAATYGSHNANREP